MFSLLAQENAFYNNDLTEEDQIEHNIIREYYKEAHDHSYNRKYSRFSFGKSRSVSQNVDPNMLKKLKTFRDDDPLSNQQKQQPSLRRAKSKFLGDNPSNVEAELNYILPKLDWKLIAQTENQISSIKLRTEGEAAMRDWVSQLVEEIDRLESFYKDRLTELKKEYKKLKFQMTTSTQSKTQSEVKLQTKRPLNITEYQQLREQSLNTYKKDQEGNSETLSLLGSQQSSGHQLKHVGVQKQNRAKDELELATNWRRAFQDIYTNLKWLNAFTTINVVAIQKAIDKFMKSYFLIKDNIIDKKLLAYLDSKEFSRKKDVNRQQKKIIRFFANLFENGSERRARYAMEKKDVEMRRQDLIQISIFSGALAVIAIVAILVLLIPGAEDPWEDWIEIFSNLFAFRFLLMIIVVLVFSAVDIYILRKFKINYLFIFELDPNYKITHIQLTRSFMIKLDYLFDEVPAIFTLIAICLFVLICFFPFHCFYLKARKNLLFVLINILISPFGIVRFKHFFMADIITSFINPLKDMGNVGCYFVRGLWEDSEETNNQNCPHLENYKITIAFIPFWFRLMQCFRRYHDTKVRAHLINGGKYFSSILVQTAGAFNTKFATSNTLYILISISIYSTCYSLYWDFIMDWGMFRTKEKGKKYLRSKLFYPVWFYYYAMVCNVILRFFWIVPLIHVDKNGWLSKSHSITLFLTLAEGYRRAQWALLRIENENVNNFEKYRNILQIPAFIDDDSIEKAPKTRTK
ncbi:xenotropic and polytropic retrovirus receptor 1 [Stylonychia lemnae]|uniref:Xenotropic and polytropic retrovirus receptor 1 n=1 Tax=Stylonychia lemnae TaxID=5949 RepID=A0A078BDX4_STYLE|nr:xenotropic and polytropic retrovirus receptor 1 [Stylonychia lemnae]|eukprot:CDW91778.1 xenotropic and polytropic retrovirus receptor 1 [Stylonychia lemnae]